VITGWRWAESASDRSPPLWPALASAIRRRRTSRAVPLVPAHVPGALEPAGGDPDLERRRGLGAQPRWAGARSPGGRLTLSSVRSQPVRELAPSRLRMHGGTGRTPRSGRGRRIIIGWRANAAL